MATCPHCDNAFREDVDGAIHNDVACKTALEAEVERLREALIWYAESDNYMHTFNRVSGETVLDRMYSAPEKIEAGWRPVVLDAGKRARHALSQSSTLVENSTIDTSKGST